MAGNFREADVSSNSMVLNLETTSNLWNGVSGVPGLGVSIPGNRLPPGCKGHPSKTGSHNLASVESEWDRHESKHFSRKHSLDCDVMRDSGNSYSKRDGSEGKMSSKERNTGPLSISGVKVELPRVISPRSSSCRSSGRSTGSRGSSAIGSSQGGSGGSTSSAKYSSNRSDSAFGSCHPSAPLPHIHSPPRGDSVGGSQGRIPQHDQGHHNSSSSSQYPTSSHHQAKSASSVKSFHSRQSSRRRSLSTCECVCTCGDPVPPKPVRRVMFSDDTLVGQDHCDCCSETSSTQQAETRKRSLNPAIVYGGRPDQCEECSCDSQPGHHRGPGSGEDSALSSGDSGQTSNNHYKSPRDVDGEYSYAYSDSVSPAFLIRVGAAMDYSGSMADSEASKDENIYEEIRENSEENQKSDDHDSGKSSSASQDNSGHTLIPNPHSATKSKFQKALDAVTRRSGRSLDAGSEKSFHLSISKGRKKSLIDKAKIDWDCDTMGPSGMVSKLNKSHSDMFGDVTESHNLVMSQLKLDVEDMLMPPPSPPGDETQDDSGFHSGGMSSSGTGSCSPKTKRKSIMKTSKTAKRSESQPGRINRCESIDFKEVQMYQHGGEAGVQKPPTDMFRTRSRIVSGHENNYGVYGPPSSSFYGVPPHPPVLCSSKKRPVNRNYLQKLVSFPLFGSNRNSIHQAHQHPPPMYGKTNKPPEFEAEAGRTFYL